MTSASAAAGEQPRVGLSWRGVSWHTRVAGSRSSQEQRVLHELMGHARPGQVTALMGPSGSGKTTLLDILALRKTLGRIEGQVLVDGLERRPGAFQRASAYIPHEDALLPTLTVSETMQYHAEMRMTRGTTPEEKRARVDEALRLVGLQRAVRTAVGGALPGGLSLRGLSGGEKRRLSIATAMLPRPSLIFADEPTSGLDALASLKVLQVFKDVAESGKIVMVTVHQPRAAIWQLLDRLYLLSEGRLMYTGPASGATAWFGTLGYQAPEDHSPADWLLDLVTVGFDKSSLGWKACNTQADVAQASRRFAGSSLMRRIEEEMESACGNFGGEARKLWPCHLSEEQTGRLTQWSIQFRTLLWRHMLNYARNLGNVAARLCLAVSSGLVVGFCYSGLRSVAEDDPRVIIDRLGAIFFICIVLMICPNCTMALFVGDRRFYVAESAAHLYGPLAYYLPMAFCELVLNIAAASLFWVPVSLLSGMRADAGGFACGALLCSLVQLCGSQITNFSALLLPSQEMAFVLSVALNIFSFITCGFLVRTQDLAACIRCLRFLSPVKLGLQALAVSELADRDFGASQHLDALRAALREIGGGGGGGGGALVAGGGGAPAWWLQQRQLRGLASHVLEQVLPCVDPCITGMVEKGAEALQCLGLQEPATVLPAVLGLLAQLMALHVAGWLCLRLLQREHR